MTPYGPWSHLFTGFRVRQVIEDHFSPDLALASHAFRSRAFRQPCILAGDDVRPAGGNRLLHLYHAGLQRQSAADLRDPRWRDGHVLRSALAAPRPPAIRSNALVAAGPSQNGLLSGWLKGTGDAIAPAAAAAPPYRRIGA